MKKNKMCRLASALLILVLLTTSIVGSTFAKYTTEGTASDTARVAKWGVTLTTGSDLFAKAYKNTKVEDTDTTATVKTSDESKLVAPGTEGTGLGVTTGGTPEVSYKVTLSLKGDAAMPTLKYTPTNGSVADYEPVKFGVYNGATELKSNIGLTELKTLFANDMLIYEYDIATGKYYVDKDLNGTISGEEKTAGSATAPVINIKWSWAFEDGTNKALYNELDTILGDTAAAATGATPITKYSGGGDNSISDIKTEVSLTWTVTATQID